MGDAGVLLGKPPAVAVQTGEPANPDDMQKGTSYGCSVLDALRYTILLILRFSMEPWLPREPKTIGLGTDRAIFGLEQGLYLIGSHRLGGARRPARWWAHVRMVLKRRPPVYVLGLLLAHVRRLLQPPVFVLDLLLAHVR
jgi:hypothetical protein